MLEVLNHIKSEYPWWVFRVVTMTMKWIENERRTECNRSCALGSCMSWRC